MGSRAFLVSFEKKKERHPYGFRLALSLTREFSWWSFLDPCRYKQ